MFKNLAVGKKIILGFSSVLVILLVVGLVAFNALNTASDGFTEYREMARDANLTGRVQANMLMVRMNVKDFIITGSEKDVEEYHAYQDKMNGFLEEAQKEIQNVKRAEKIDLVETEFQEYEAGFKKVVDFMKKRDHLYDGVLSVDGVEMERNLSNIMVSAEKDGDIAGAFQAGMALRNLLLGRLYVVKFMESNAQEDVDRMESEFAELEAHLDILDSELQNTERRELLKKVQAKNHEYQEAFKELAATIFARNQVISGTLDRIGPIIAKEVEDVKLDIKDVQDELGPRLQASNTRSEILITIIGAIALVVGIVLAIVIARGITGPVNRIVGSLAAGADQVASASGQVSSASQSLAEGASEQAPLWKRPLRLWKRCHP
jgi:methyl-accepting chemotaxis protein